MTRAGGLEATAGSRSRIAAAVSLLQSRHWPMPVAAIVARPARPARPPALAYGRTVAASPWRQSLLGSPRPGSDRRQLELSAAVLEPNHSLPTAR